MGWIGNLAPIPTSFFGRESDLRRLDDLILEGRRLLTLLGPAGAGKTRLARRFAESMAARGRFPGGVWFCDLTDARDLVGILAAAGRAFDIPLAQTTTIDHAVDKLAQSVASRGPTLLVIDNCEQVIEPAARIVARIAELAPQSISIATSRESLRVAGEHLHPVSPLAVDATSGEDSPPAVRLFIDRAKAVWPAFAPSADEHATLEEIVRRLDGLPLAIELAAARAGAHSLGTIRQRLQERFSLLTGGLRFATERQRTMRGAIDWSWNLLSPAEQRALAESAVFRGGFSLEAAEHVFSEAALDLLQSLTEKSLIAVTEVAEMGTRRYRLLESIRDYAMEKLVASGELVAVRDRHRRYYATAAFGAPELENLLSAHGHALEAAATSSAAANDAFDLLVAISEILKRRGPLDLLVSLLDSTLGDVVCAQADPRRVGRALRDRAYSRQFAPGASAAKRSDLSRALEIAQATGDVQLELDCLSVLTSVELLDGRPDAARAGAKLALSRARSIGDPSAIAKAFGDIGSCENSLGHFEEARASLLDAIALSRKANEPLALALYLVRLSEVSIELGRLDEAMANAEESLAICRPFGHHRMLASITGVLGTIEYERRDLARARAHFEDALGFAREWGAELLQPIYRAWRAAALADQDDVEEAGKELDYAEAQFARFAHESLLRASVTVGRGHLDLARARAARTTGDEGAFERARASAERRLDGLLASEQVFEDLRPMRRRLERELARTSGGPLIARETDREDEGALVIAEDGGWFRAPGSARVDLAQKANLQRVLACLTERRVRAPSEPMSLETVFRRGWPGDRADASSAANRVRVAMNRLRKLGLGDVLMNRDGYLLDPEIPIVIARSERRE